MKNGTALQAATKWVGILASVLTIALGIVHMIDAEPTLKWPEDEGFLYDEGNQLNWRFKLFSLAPNLFIDVWTPLVFGLAGVLAHFPDSGTIFTFITSNFLTFAIYHAVSGLFANLAYNGGLGIVFGSFSFLASVLAFVVAYTNEDSASLEIQIARR